jgi:xylulokinase
MLPILAAVSAGAWPSIDEACSRLVQVTGTVHPDPVTSKKLNRQYQAYRTVYAALRKIYSGLADL